MATCFDRTILIVLDSVGVGALPDAGAYGDEGSDTLGNIARRVPLGVPTLRALGLGRVASIGPAGPSHPERGSQAARLRGLSTTFGRMAEASPGKDSVTGHWEMMGVVLDRPFPVFPGGFSEELLTAFSREVGRPVIGNKAASGTAIIDELGGEHLRTGALIVYTSADSVFQIAAHEAVVPVRELHRACRVAYRLAAEGLGIGRVIARPFVGEPGRFVRTANRRDFALPPPAETLLDRMSAAGRAVVAVGKVDDLFAGRGITRAIHTTSDADGMDRVEAEMQTLERGLLFANLVDFDTQYGHRNDVAGYAQNLERFDDRLSRLLPALRESDVLVVTADHGNDPTTPSTDHSREHVPVLIAGARLRDGVSVGTRRTFADLGQTLADLFGIAPLGQGTSFLREIMR